MHRHLRFPQGRGSSLLRTTQVQLLSCCPWGTVQTQQGLAHEPEMTRRSASHVLMGSPLTEQEVLAVAEKAGLVAQSVSAGLFRFVKVWIEDSFLLELLPREHRAAYVKAFGPDGRGTLDDRLRDLERQLRAG